VHRTSCIHTRTQSHVVSPNTTDTITLPYYSTPFDTLKDLQNRTRASPPFRHSLSPPALASHSAGFHHEPSINQLPSLSRLGKVYINNYCIYVRTMFFVYDLLGIGNQNLLVCRYSWGSVGSTHLARARFRTGSRSSQHNNKFSCVSFFSQDPSLKFRIAIHHYPTSFSTFVFVFHLSSSTAQIINHTPNPNIPLSHPFLILSHILLSAFPFLCPNPVSLFRFSVILGFRYIRH